MNVGDVPCSISFLLKGIIRGYVIDESGREITDCFASHPMDAIIGCNAMGQPSLVSFEALTDCDILRIPLSTLNELMQRHPVMHQMYNKLLQEALLRHWQLKRILYQPAMQRYQWFLASYPGLADQVSSRHVASFLGLTPVTISRLKRRLREEGNELRIEGS